MAVHEDHTCGFEGKAGGHRHVHITLWSNYPDQAKAFEDVLNYYYQKASQGPVNYSSTQGLQTAAVERAAIEASVAEAQRRTQATTTTASQTVGTPATASSTPVIINVGTTQARIRVSSPSDANTLAGVLAQLDAQQRVSI